MTTAEAIDRVRKMLSLAANNNSPEEAAQAAAQAQRLMQKYEIEEAQVRAESQAEAEEIDEDFAADSSQNSVVPWKGVLMSAMAKTMGFKYWWAKGGRGNPCVLKLYGRQSQLRAATYMYEYLVQEINRLASLTSDSSRSFRNAFRFGAAVTIRERLIEAKEMADTAFKIAAQDSGQGGALMVISNDAKALDKAYEGFKKRIGIRAGRRATVSSPSGFESGKAAGRNISLGGSRGQLGGATRQLGPA